MSGGDGVRSALEHVCAVLECGQLLLEETCLIAQELGVAHQGHLGNGRRSRLQLELCADGDVGKVHLDLGLGTEVEGSETALTD